MASMSEALGKNLLIRIKETPGVRQIPPGEQPREGELAILLHGEDTVATDSKGRPCAVMGFGPLAFPDRTTLERVTEDINGIAAFSNLTFSAIDLDFRAK